MRKNRTIKRALSLLLIVMTLFSSAVISKQRIIANAVPEEEMSRTTGYMTQPNLSTTVNTTKPNQTTVYTTQSSSTITSYSVGDIVEFGWYPQSEVTDSSIISKLNAEAGDNKNWTSYNYYSGTGTTADGKMTASDYMRYTDIILDSNKYRGVVFDSYRPDRTGYVSSAENSNQDNNGYNTNTVYWFKYEPIRWCVLDPKTGMVMSETILDSQAFNNYLLYFDGEDYGNAEKTYYANNYAESSIRKWLNEDFYNTAFSPSQKTVIATTMLDNSAFSDPRPQSSTYMIDCSCYSSSATEDRIYILSYADATNEDYGFSTSFAEHNIARQAYGSDYAEIQGLTTLYWLRSAGYYSYYVWHINDQGYVGCGARPNECRVGVRPVLNLKTETIICNCKIEVPSTTTITYGDSIILHANAENLPSSAKIVWEASNGNFGYSVSTDGTTCTITPKTSGDTVFTAKIVDKDGNVISSATQKMTSKAGLWQKIVAFFKNLFGKNQVIPYIAKSLLG